MDASATDEGPDEESAQNDAISEMLYDNIKKEIAPDDFKQEKQQTIPENRSTLDALSDSDVKMDQKEQTNQQDVAATLSEPTPSLSSRFEVDVNQIESVGTESQDADIQSLGLTVYDQNTLERGIWDQVEKETRKREAQEELANVSTKLKLAEEQLKRVESAKGAKRSILQSALQEPSSKKSSIKKHQEVTQEKVKELRSKQAELHARLSGAKTSKGSESIEETERDRKIRMGEMTPFGTALNASSSDMNSFEKYLKSQQELHKKMISNATTKKKQSTSVTFGSNKEEKSLHPSFKNKTPTKPILKKSILFPKKRRPNEKLGTDTSTLEEDQQRSPGNVPGESTVVNIENSGSEYVPSESDDGPKKKRNVRESGSRVDKNSSLQSTKRRSGSGSDRWAAGSLKRRKIHEKTLANGDPEEWCSDDSDWICTDDEDFSGDENSGQKTKKHSKRGKDDGNSEEFFRRIKHWEKQNEGLREQMENEVHEFENGYKLPSLIWDKLYMYQQVGVRWMWELNQQRCGGILGDEMGLGKTIQIIAFLTGLSVSKMKCRTTGYRGLGPTLIVCPTTVMHQWVREFHTWFPPLRVAILHESGSFVGKRSQLVREMLQDKGIIITSYTAVVRLKDHLLHQRWHYVILDEGHKIRNPDAQVTLAVKQLRTPHRLVLSGSPLQNHLRELWSLMDFVFPGKLGTLPVFMSEFAVPINQGGYSNASEVMVATAYKCATVLRDTISPYLLRRMKADVSEHIKLPSKNEQVLFCRLTDEQRDLYKEYLKCGEVGRILDGRCQIFVGLINLRKICNHPHIFSGGPKLFGEEKEEDIRLDERFGYWEKAGKMIVIEALLKIWHKQEHRVLIFTQSRQMLLIIEKFVSDCGYRYLKMDGGTSIAARQPMIRKFNEDKSFFVMLLTTKVGGLGVNLTGANRVVIYDPDWNPATDTQARERAWRIGQQNAVTVYRLITAGTIEEKMYHRQIFKQFLCNKVLKDPRQRRFFKSNDLLELFTLKETDDGTTETSAIFAGTDSQESHKTGKDKREMSHSLHSHRFHKKKDGKSEACTSTDGTGNQSKPDTRETKINFSQDKLDHMKKLAHELSLKLSSKVSATANKVLNEKEIRDTPIVNYDDCGIENPNDQIESSLEETHNVSNATDLVNDLVPVPEDDTSKAQTNMESQKKNNKDTAVALRENMITLEGIEFTDNDSDEDLEDMKQFAKELSKELSQKVKTAAAINHSRTPDKSGICRNTMSSKNSPKGTIDLINCDSGSVNCDKETFNTGSEIPKPLLVDSDRSSSTKPSTSIERYSNFLCILNHIPL
ncbi:hypothetical protein ONE63_007757 [Megalurothrips usitatus]|uniref:DNA repair and recombination protein RAD54-like n=1 Tax=Megalurothrips usitatus TaxID=439358 RepID=A0AAV7XSX1_9NEOP|nr:hypothetical protein ONE63_007757 [Megalurothrips usitatus]